MRAWLGVRPVAGFVLLTFGISYLVGGPVLLAGMMLAPHPGLLRTYVPRIGVVYGPALAALMLAHFSHSPSPSVLLRRLIPARTDVPAAAGVLLAGGAATAIAALAAGISPTALWSQVHAHVGLLVAHFALQVALVAAGEELGWRGWLLPQAMARTNRLNATLGTGVVWGLWHAPLLVGGDGGAAVMFLLFVLGLSVVFTWLWTLTHPSLFPVIVAHATVNAPLFFWEQISAGAPGGDERLRRAWYILQLSYATAGLVLVLARWRWWTARETPSAATIVVDVIESWKASRASDHGETPATRHAGYSTCS